MKHVLAKTLAAAILSSLGTSVQARTLTIGLDLSGSNPLLGDRNFADQAARHAVRAIEALKSGDVVRVKSFGARDDARNLLDRSVTIGRRMRSARVAKAVGDYLRSLPEQAQAGQSSTNLLAWLEFGSGFGCEEEGQILVITDGLESSSLVDGRALIAGKARLPAPQVSLKGCALTFYGLGAGWPATQVRTLRDEWSRWAEKAEARFTPIIP